MTGFPEMYNEFSDWERSITYSAVTKTLINHEIVESAPVSVTISCLVYPAKAQELALKPEGQRTWKFWHMISKVLFNVDDIVTDDNGTQFRIMGKTDWTQAGFYNYDIAEGFI